MHYESIVIWAYNSSLPIKRTTKKRKKQLKKQKSIIDNVMLICQALEQLFKTVLKYWKTFMLKIQKY